MRRLIVMLVCFIACFVQCKMINEPAPAQPVVEDEETLEAREDSIALANAYAAQAKITRALTPEVQTSIMRATTDEDAADDPAIWKHPTNRQQSLVFGSNKKGGLAAYDLSGQETAYYPIGNINNVDVLYQFPMKTLATDLLGCTNRTKQGIDLFRIDPNSGALLPVAADSMLVHPELIDDIYGFCFAFDKATQRYYAVINGKNGLMQQFELQLSDDKIALQLARSVRFDSQVEGMVADNDTGFLYVGEEGKGIWKLPISPADTTKVFISNSGEENPNIHYDVEGLTLLKTNRKTYLIASSQGNFSYAVFDLSNKDAYVASFIIAASDSIDGVEETDGLDVTSDSLSAVFPHGMLVVQDGFNFEGDTMFPQNFKFIRLEQLIDLF